MKTVALILKETHSQESKEIAREKAIQVIEKLKAMNNTIERFNREIKCRTKTIGAFPDGQSALMSVCARLRHVAATSWGARR